MGAEHSIRPNFATELHPLLDRDGRGREGPRTNKRVCNSFKGRNDLAKGGRGKKEGAITPASGELQTSGKTSLETAL